MPKTPRPPNGTIAVPGASVAFGTGGAHVFTTAPLKWLVNGYRRAVERFRTASEREDRSTEEVFYPLFEALNWFDSVDEYAKGIGKPIGEKHVRAIRYARRRVHHQWSDAIYPKSFSVAAKMSIAEGVGLMAEGWTFDWFWRATANLPPTLSGYQDAKGERMYETLLAEKPARDAFESIAKYLSRTF